MIEKSVTLYEDLNDIQMFGGTLLWKRDRKGREIRYILGITESVSVVTAHREMCF
jgi:hypothetical protein